MGDSSRARKGVLSALQFDNTLLDKVFQKSADAFVARGQQRVQGVSATNTSDAYPGQKLKDNSVLNGIGRGLRVFYVTSSEQQPSGYAPASLALTSPVNAFTEVCMHFLRNRMSLTVMAFGAVCTAIVPNEVQSGGTAAQWTPLIDAVSGRLTIADQVALIKWDTGKPIEDLPREQAVIAAAVQNAAAYRLSGTYAAAFFADQIEANKLIQYGLLANWHRSGSAPQVPRADLQRTIRPQLDALEARLLQALSAAAQLRSAPGCANALARCIRSYAAEHHYDPLHAVALDRALARVCISSAGTRVSSGI
jgi:chorismate mutase